MEFHELCVTEGSPTLQASVEGVSTITPSLHAGTGLHLYPAGRCSLQAAQPLQAASYWDKKGPLLMLTTGLQAPGWQGTREQA